MNKNVNPYSLIPKVDDILVDERLISLNAPYKVVIECTREVLSELREAISSANAKKNEMDLSYLGKDQIIEVIKAKVMKRMSYKLKKIINASGVVIHTNLGRSLLSEKACQHVYDVAGGYSNLEFNLDNGKRGSRYDLVEELICKLTGCESAMVVNNNAAAVMLVLSSVASGKKVVVSRGQLVEIGGAFRIPEVMRLSGCDLVEVGTTNKTHLRDYENVIDNDVSAILKVHTSNYRILGFTSEVSAQELSLLAQKHGIPLIEDIGSGSLIDFSKYGLSKEPTVIESLAEGVDILTFSGDKMLGAPQAGIIVGKKKYIDLMKKNQLTRALRVDKMTLAGLEATLMEYFDEEAAVKNIPTLRMLTENLDVIHERAQKISKDLIFNDQTAKISIIEGESEVGGGSMPLEKLPTKLIAIESQIHKPSSVSEMFRQREIPVICRISNDLVLLDARTVLDDEIEILQRAMMEVYCG